MKIPSQQLEAFFELSHTRSFSRAAELLGITQSAMSQRIMKLEDLLNCTLVLRDSHQISLSPAGERLLQYSRAVKKMEDECWADLSSSQAEIRGQLYINAYSSLMCSVVIPSLSPLVRDYPLCQLHFNQLELRDVEDALINGPADIVFSNKEISRKGIVAELVGFEKNVLIESKKFSSREDVFLDHDQFDSTTFDFLKLQGNRNPQPHRVYYDEVYSILEGVRQGHGRAVVPLHLVQKDPKLKIVKTKKIHEVPVYLNYCDKGYLTRLEAQVVKILRTEVSRQLSLV